MINNNTPIYMLWFPLTAPSFLHAYTPQGGGDLGARVALRIQKQKTYNDKTQNMIYCLVKAKEKRQIEQDTRKNKTNSIHLI